MKKLSNTGAELKKAFLMKKKRVMFTTQIKFEPT